jgi:hypothetical protein
MTNKSNNPFPTTDKLKLGFDRTQLYKEYEAPMIRRQSAMTFTQRFFEQRNIQCDAKDLKLLYNRFLEMIETGDDTFLDRIDTYLEKKYNYGNTED